MAANSLSLRFSSKYFGFVFTRNVENSNAIFYAHNRAHAFSAITVSIWCHYTNTSKSMRCFISKALFHYSRSICHLTIRVITISLLCLLLLLFGCLVFRSSLSLSLSLFYGVCSMLFYSVSFSISQNENDANAFFILCFCVCILFGRTCTSRTTHTNGFSIPCIIDHLCFNSISSHVVQIFLASFSLTLCRSLLFPLKFDTKLKHLKLCTLIRKPITHS